MSGRRDSAEPAKELARPLAWPSPVRFFIGFHWGGSPNALRPQTRRNVTRTFPILGARRAATVRAASRMAMIERESVQESGTDLMNTNNAPDSSPTSPRNSPRTSPRTSPPTSPNGPMKDPPRQNERGVPNQPGEVKGPRTPPEEADKPREPIAPDERGG